MHSAARIAQTMPNRSHYAQIAILLVQLVLICGQRLRNIAAYPIATYAGASRSRFRLTLWRYAVALLGVLASAHCVVAGQQWELDNMTIGESTDVYERVALSTAGRPNTNNMNLNVPGRPDLNLAIRHNSLVFMTSNVLPQFAIALEPWLARQLHLDAAAFYFQGFLWWDVSPFLDSSLNKVNQSAPTFNRWAGDGWSLNSFGTNELLAEVMDAYLDVRKDFDDAIGIGLRLGKERLENGNEIDRLFRVANVIDSLDFRRDIVFPDPFGSIDSFVIGQWTVQPTLHFRNLPRWHLSDPFVTGWLSQFQPDYFPAAGTAINILPSNLILYNWNANKPVFGTIAGTTINDALDLRFNYYHTGQGHGVFYTPAGYGPCGPKNSKGEPVLDCQRRVFPEDDIIGSTFNYYIAGQTSALADSILGHGSIGGSVEYRPTMTFANPHTKSGAPFLKEGNLTFALSFRNSWASFSDKYRTYGLVAYEYDSKR
jgi:hypothetical protein